MKVRKAAWFRTESWRCLIAMLSDFDKPSAHTERRSCSRPTPKQQLLETSYHSYASVRVHVNHTRSDENHSQAYQPEYNLKSSSSSLCSISNCCTDIRNNLFLILWERLTTRGPPLQKLDQAVPSLGTEVAQNEVRNLVKTDFPLQRFHKGVGPCLVRNVNERNIGPCLNYVRVVGSAPLQVVLDLHNQAQKLWQDILPDLTNKFSNLCN